MKNFYLLARVAQIMEKGNLLKESILKNLDSDPSLFDSMLEELRTKLIGSIFLAKPIQRKLPIP